MIFMVFAELVRRRAHTAHRASQPINQSTTLPAGKQASKRAIPPSHLSTQLSPPAHSRPPARQPQPQLKHSASGISEHISEHRAVSAMQGSLAGQVLLPQRLSAGRPIMRLRAIVLSARGTRQIPDALDDIAPSTVGHVVVSPQQLSACLPLRFHSANCAVFSASRSLTKAVAITDALCRLDGGLPAHHGGVHFRPLVREVSGGLAHRRRLKYRTKYRTLDRSIAFDLMEHMLNPSSRVCSRVSTTRASRPVRA